MFQLRKLQIALGAAALLGHAGLQAQMAQDPLLSRTAAVEPSIVFVLDDSGSMNSTAIYQYGGSQGYQGQRGPGNDSECNTYPPAANPDIDDCIWTLPPGSRPGADGTRNTSKNRFYGQSPDVNLMYYDPRVTYKRRINADGTYQAAGSTSGITFFNVFFYKPASSSTYGVQSVAVTSGGGGYGGGVTGTFPVPPAGGVRATATVQTGTRYPVTGFNITNSGYGYGNTVGIQFSAPPAGGVQATGTLVTTDVYAAQTGAATILTRGRDLPAAGLTFTFPAAPAGGATATATATTMLSKKVNTITQLTQGSCAASATATVSAPQTAGGIRATVTFVRQGGGGNRPITSISINERGSGYTAAPTITWTNCNTAPTATITLADTYILNAVNVTAGGGGYAATPTGTFGNLGGGVAPTVTVAGIQTKKITGFNLTNGGAGYTSPPTWSLTNAGGGTGFAGNVVATGSNTITGITVTNAGSGYTTQPIFTLANTGGGTGAAFSYTYTTTTTGGVNKKWDGADTPTTATSYFTPNYLPDAGSPLAATATTTLTYPNTATSSVTQYPKFRNRTDCAAATHCTWNEELQNYANWKAYHSTRNMLARTGIGLAFQPLNPTFRLGWGTINQLQNNNQLANNAGVRKYTSAVQTSFLSWLYTGAPVSPNNGTPNRNAINKLGQYFERTDDAGPWGNDPTGSHSLTNTGTANAAHATCRRAYAMLMTDGYYNETFTLSDYDTTNGPIISSPSSFQYTPIGPYSDSNGTAIANTFADVAMKYWVRDLRTDLGNNVRTVPTDNAFWQHLNFYAIGLGVVGTLDATNPTVLAELSGTGRTRNWPTPSNNSSTAIDDMWHATINGRGSLLNAKTSDELNEAITKMMSDISGREGTQSGVAVSTTSLTRGTKKYTPSYTPVTWNGNVTAFQLNETSGVQTGVAWQVETLVSTDPVTGKRTYSSLIPAAAQRNIAVGNGATSGVRAVPFTFSGMGTLVSQMAPGTNASLIDYLRGDATNEDNDASAASATAIYRPRLTRLGDIVNSTPSFVKDSVDLQYDHTDSAVSGKASYRVFVTAKKARQEGVIFVGANDGMLHAFRDGTYDSNGNMLTQGGIEVFAYVPHALLPSLHNLADKTYVHRYYVDGPIVETDAYLGGAWKNIILGSTGAGAGVQASAGVSPRAAVFALDVTSLNSSPTSLTTTNVLWEVNSTMADFAELGYMLTDVQTGYTKSGRWVAIFGNGYESKSCQASLFVVDLQTGARVREISTGAGSCGAGTRNGLGGVRVVKNKAKEIVGVYGGDLQGKMWKFNLNSASEGSWGVDLGGTALYAAGATAPITAQPTVLPLPMVGTTDPKPGYMVVFGTGKFYEVSDIATTTQQSLYGIWDPAEFGAGTAAVGLTNRSALVGQTIGPAQTGPNGNTYFAISNNAITYTGASAKRGWYIDYPNTGQRLVYPLDLLADRFAVADTISPANVSLDPCQNENGGVGYLYIVDALNGGGPTEAILDTNGDGNVDSNDMIVSGIEGKADGRNVSLLVSKNDLETKYANVSGGDPGATLLSISCRLTNTCKTAAGGVRRQWRQLFLR